MPEKLPTGAFITGWLLLALVAGIVWLISTYPQQPSERPFAYSCESDAQSQDDTYHTNNTANSVPSITEKRHSTVDDSERNANESNRTDERRLAEYTCQLAVYTAQLASFTKWLVIVTIFVAGIGMWQGYHLGRHVNAVEANSEKRLRAYVQLSVDPTMVIYITDSQPLYCRIDIKNVGQTPAHKVEFHGNICAAELGRALPDIVIPKEKSRIVIHPGQGFGSTISADNPITSADVQRLREDPEYRVFLYGLIEYEDIFGIPRATKFRWMTPPPQQGPSRFIPCYEGNAAT